MGVTLPEEFMGGAIESSQAVGVQRHAPDGGYQPVALGGFGLSGQQASAGAATLLAASAAGGVALHEAQEGIRALAARMHAGHHPDVLAAAMRLQEMGTSPPAGVDGHAVPAQGGPGMPKPDVREI